MDNDFFFAKGMLWDILFQYITPILLIGLGVLAIVLIILVVISLIDIIKGEER